MESIIKKSPYRVAAYPIDQLPGFIVFHMPVFQRGPFLNHGSAVCEKRSYIIRDKSKKHLRFRKKVFYRRHHRKIRPGKEKTGIHISVYAGFFFS